MTVRSSRLADPRTLSPPVERLLKALLKRGLREEDLPAAVLLAIVLDEEEGR